jgi:hypothetical protein
MRARLSYLACLVTVLTVGITALPAEATSSPRDPGPAAVQAAQVPMLETLLSSSGRADVDGRTSARTLAAPSARAEVRFPRNFARLLARSASFGRDPVRVHRELRQDTKDERLGEYVHVGPLRGRRFTITVISDQACAVVGRRGEVEDGPCTPADRRASMTPLQDSAEMLVWFARDIFEYGSRAQAAREALDPVVLRFVSHLVAPNGVDVSAISDPDKDGIDDDARVAFHADGKSVCASLPLTAKARGAVTFGSCQRLRPREVEIHERIRTVFWEMKRGADIGARSGGATMERRVRRAARYARLISSHSEAATRIMGDRVQFRARVNDRIRFACYHVSPENKPATYSRSGKPGTWRLGRCG